MITIGRKQAANSNCPDSPILALDATGNGKALYRALARILVRRELIIAGALPVEEHSDAPLREPVAPSLNVA